MPDYQETPVAGTKWQRCNCVHIDNPNGGQPMVTFAEEEVVALGGESFTKPATQIVFPFDPSDVIQLRNPQDGELSGQSITAADVYVALYSFYIQKAYERDAAL